MTRECPATGCTKNTSPDMLMCRAHWHLVSKAIQRRVQAAWGDGLGAGSRAHQAAMTAATEAVNRKLAVQP